MATLLENEEMQVLSATNGRQAIDMIKSTPDLSVVLMDIMMPEMDGYETMREIRRLPEFRTLPIGEMNLKGKGQSVRIFCVLNPKKEHSVPLKPEPELTTPPS